MAKKSIKTGKLAPRGCLDFTPRLRSTTPTSVIEAYISPRPQTPEAALPQFCITNEGGTTCCECYFGWCYCHHLILKPRSSERRVARPWARVSPCIYLSVTCNVVRYRRRRVTKSKEKNSHDNARFHGRSGRFTRKAKVIGSWKRLFTTAALRIRHFSGILQMLGQCLLRRVGELHLQGSAPHVALFRQRSYGNPLFARTTGLVRRRE